MLVREFETGEQMLNWRRNEATNALELNDVVSWDREWGPLRTRLSGARKRYEEQEVALDQVALDRNIVVLFLFPLVNFIYSS